MSLRTHHASIFGCALLLWVASASAQPATPQQAPRPAAPEWTPIGAGWDVYLKKGCAQCHGIRSSKGHAAPDLARIPSGAGFYELGAAMWNHLPRMGAKMRAAGIERPTLTPLELVNVLAFIFTAQYNDDHGNVKTGERLFTAKACVRCHAVGGKGGNVGPALDALKHIDSPVLVAARMWSHGLRMAEAMQSKGIERPIFERNEFVDVIAYITASAADPGVKSAQVLPGTPAEGEALFRDKHCVSCHTIDGKGGKAGPDLGRAHHVSLTQFAGLMWNHGPAMWARMKERGIEAPPVTGQEMADIVAYLYSAQYFDPAAGDSRRGQQVVQTKGCGACHAVRGKGGTAAADLATSSVVGVPAALVAAMWNHSRSMEDRAAKQGLTLPTLKGQELADLAAYFRSLTKATSTPRSE
jgi:mono/diheme cytochrome c family protein